jgi:hypothetical protein
MDTWLFGFAAIQAIGVVLAFFRVDIRLLAKSRQTAMMNSTKREKVMAVLAFGSLALCGIAFYTRPPKSIPETLNNANPEKTIKSWLSDSGNAFIEITDPKTIFTLSITEADGSHFMVYRYKGMDNKLFFNMEYSLPDGLPDALAKLSHADQLKFISGMYLELARAKVAWRQNGNGTINNPSITLNEGKPMRDITETSFFQVLDDFEHAAELCRASAQNAINNATPNP